MQTRLIRSGLLILLSLSAFSVSLFAQPEKYVSIKPKTTGPGDTIVGESVAKPIVISKNKGSNAYVVMDWVKPDQVTATTSAAVLELELKIFSSAPVTREQVKILVNGKVTGAKADEAGLFGTQNEFTYKGTIPLISGLNKIEAEVTQGTLIKRSSALSITRSAGAVSSAPVQTFLYWMSPNPLELEGKPLVVKDPEQEINLNIIVPEAITASQLRILLNDKPQPLSPRATLKGSSNRYSLRDFLTLDERQPINKVSLAVMVQGREYRSEPLLLNFTPFKPNLHLLAIGTQSNLQFAMKDADDFSRLYGSQGGVAGNRLFNSIQVENLLGKDATASNISRQVEKLYTKFITGNIDSSDLLVLYISTHGFLAEDGEFRLQGNDFDASARRSTSVSYNDDILAILDRLPCKKLVLIDACHSGGISGSKASPSAVNLEIEKLNKVKKGLTTIVSSQGFEQSYEDVLWQNGAFTRCILDGLALGKADTDRNKIITIQELYAYLSKEVPAMVKKVKNQAQTPRLINNELGNVAIFVLD